MEERATVGKNVAMVSGMVVVLQESIRALFQLVMMGRRSFLRRLAVNQERQFTIRAGKKICPGEESFLKMALAVFMGISHCSTI